MARPGQAILGQRVQVISQPGIRKAALRYLTTVAAGLRPRNGRPARRQPDHLRRVPGRRPLGDPQPDPAHPRPHRRIPGPQPQTALAGPGRPRPARRPVRQQADRNRPALFPRRPDPVGLNGRPHGCWSLPTSPAGQAAAPRPAPDTDLMTAISRLADPLARTRLTLLRGTGIRLGDLLDLELHCVWYSASHGSRLKVPLGKLATARRSHPGCPRRMDRPAWPAAGTAAAEPGSRLPVHRTRPPPVGLPAPGRTPPGRRSRRPAWHATCSAKRPPSMRVDGILTARSIIIKAARPIVLPVGVPDFALSGEDITVQVTPSEPTRHANGTIAAAIDGLAPGAHTIDVTGPRRCHHSRPPAATSSSGKPQYGASPTRCRHGHHARHPASAIHALGGNRRAAAVHWPVLRKARAASVMPNTCPNSLQPMPGQHVPPVQRSSAFR